MQHEGGLGGQDTNHQGHSNCQPLQLGIGRSIRPGNAVPPAVLIADMCDGELFLHGLREAPSAYLTSSDAMPLRCALAAAFGSTALTRCGDPGEAL
jgi:hypothetical protein